MHGGVASSSQEQMSEPLLQRRRTLEMGVISNSAIKRSKQLPFIRLVMSWNMFLGLAGGTAIYMTEWDKRDSPSWFKCFYMALNAACATGLTAFDITKLRTGSLVLLAAVMQLGAATLVSLVPVVLRIAALEVALPKPPDGEGEENEEGPIDDDSPRRDEEKESQVVPLPKKITTTTTTTTTQWWREYFRLLTTRQRQVVTFDLRRYRLVPQWLVEYKALCYLVRIVLAYHVVVYAVYGGMLWLLVSQDHVDYRESREEIHHANPFAWSMFHVISAFNNVGFTLQNNGVVGFAEERKPYVLIILGCLVVHGNVFFPPLLRWTIVFLSARSPKDSNRKVYFRYLLLHGRRLYTNLFSSQANWLLVATQVALFLSQVVVTLVVSRNDPGFRKTNSFTTRLNFAAFLAVNCRHAGITPVDLKQLHGATLVLMLAMMWLAPVPFVVALRSSSRKVRTTTLRASGHEEDRRQQQHQQHQRGGPPITTIATQQPPMRRTPTSVSFQQDEEDTETGTSSVRESESNGDSGRNRFRRTASLDSEVRRRHSLGRLISSIFHGQENPKDDDDDSVAGPPSVVIKNPRRSSDDSNSEDTDSDNLSTRGPAAAAHVPDAMVDTRALLLERYPVSSPPWTLRVSTRWNAFKYHTRRAAKDAYRTSGFTRDAAGMFLAWFLIASFENFSKPTTGLFYTIFELVSAFGNVGFSLGSLMKPDANVSFSHDLCFGSLVVMCVVMIGARSRDLPNRIDSSLTYPNLAATDVLLATTVVTDQGTALDIVGDGLHSPSFSTGRRGSRSFGPATGTTDRPTPTSSSSSLNNQNSRGPSPLPAAQEQTIQADMTTV